MQQRSPLLLTACLAGAALLGTPLPGAAAPLAAGSPGEDDPALVARLREALDDLHARAAGFKDRFEAQVWLTDMERRLAPYVPDRHERLELLRLTHREASRAGLPPELVLAVMEVESRFDRWAISRAGAQGLMQVMPFWLERLGRPEESLFDPRVNLRLGCTILRHYLEREDGDLVRALARYHGSYPATAYAERVLEALSRRWYRR